MNVVLNEPFRLCEIEGFGFLIVDQIARKTTFFADRPHAQAQSDLHRHHQSKEKGDPCRSQTRAGTGDPDERHRQTQHAAWQKDSRKHQ